MFRSFLAVFLLVLLTHGAGAEEAPATKVVSDLQSLLQQNARDISRPSRRTISPVIDGLLAANPPGLREFLNAWQSRKTVRRKDDGLFFIVKKDGRDKVKLLDVGDGSLVAEGVSDDLLDEIRPNGGVRRVIAEALVRFQLSDPDLAKRREAIETIARSQDPGQLEPLKASIPGEEDAALKARKELIAIWLTARFGQKSAERVEAIGALSGDISVEGRAVLNRILETEFTVAPALPEGANIAREYEPGDDISRDEAYAALVKAGLAEPRPTDAEIVDALRAHIEGGRSGGVPLAQMDKLEARERGYAALAARGLVPVLVSAAEMDESLASHVFFDRYIEDDPAVTSAARDALDGVNMRVGAAQAVDLSLDALSLASIYFLAAIGLAITFGVMGVINMAHGEFIMMGAYTGYVVQQFVPDYTLSLVVALPLAFAVTFAAGVAMERLVIRHLYHRPLETLLATFGISVALQQIAKNIFGTQARPLTSPDWLGGALVVNDVIQISNIRIAILVLALMFLGLILFILKKTRLGLEVRTVTQNPRMAASMGINPDRINMMTFGLGSGIAGIAGVAIGLYAKVTSEMGGDYIVQSFMTVVVGGVGNVWGALAGAAMIGGFQKGVEWLNPGNTLAAQTFMILFIILFIQFRPKGIVALKGRAAGD